jgi:intron-binding protein aquarius
LKSLALSNFASIERRPDLQRHFNALTYDEILRLCEFLNIRTNKLVGEGQYDKDFLVEVLICKFEKRTSQIDLINSKPIYPDEVSFLLNIQFYLVD